MVATTLVCARRESAKRRYDLQSPGSSTVLTTEHVHRTSQTIIHNSLHRNAACCKFPRTSANTNASLRAPAHSLAMPLTTHCMRHVSNTIREHNSKPSLILLSEIATHSISICILSKVSCRGSQSALTSIAKHRHALPCHRHEHLEQRKIQSHRIYCTKRGALISIACNAACQQFFAPCTVRANLLSFTTPRTTVVTDFAAHSNEAYCALAPHRQELTQQRRIQSHRRRADQHRLQRSMSTILCTLRRSSKLTFVHDSTHDRRH